MIGKRNVGLFPENEVRVFFAAYNQKPVNPYCYTNFESLLKYLAQRLRLEI